MTAQQTADNDARTAVAALGRMHRTALAYKTARAIGETQTCERLYMPWALRGVLHEITTNERMNEIMADGNNTLGKLNEHLFAELERLSSADATDADALKAEIDRAHAIEGMAKAVVENANTVLTATRMRAEYTKNATVPKMLEG